MHCGCSHEIKRHLLLRRKAMSNLDNILQSRDITLLTKVHQVKAMYFPVVMCGCESWIIRKAEHWRIDGFELCCWRRPLRVSSTGAPEYTKIQWCLSPIVGPLYPRFHIHGFCQKQINILICCLLKLLMGNLRIWRANSIFIGKIQAYMHWHSSNPCCSRVVLMTIIPNTLMNFLAFLYPIYTAFHDINFLNLDCLNRQLIIFFVVLIYISPRANAMGWMMMSPSPKFKFWNLIGNLIFGDGGLWKMSKL